VVHPITARSVDRASYGQRSPTLSDREFRAELSGPAHYVLVPDLLIVTFAHDPLAVGVYVAIARLVLVAKGAVSLAARDLATWMGNNRDADRAAIMRRIMKLEAVGWLMIERTTAKKHRLLPTWGRDQAGQTQPWCFETPARGRPSHLRGRRVPVALFDDYLGRLEPYAGQGAALVSRYFTQPLLDLTDIGVYTIGLRAEITPTPRLCHLGLHGVAGMLSPSERRSLLEQAAAGALTRLEGDAKQPVLLSIQGQAWLDAVAASTPLYTFAIDEHPSGSDGRSAGGSKGGSPNLQSEAASAPQQEAKNNGPDRSSVLIAWDVGKSHESTNHDSTPDHVLQAGGGKPDSNRSTSSPEPHTQAPITTNRNRAGPAHDDLAQIAPALAACVVEGHRGLNPQRSILPGEWCELLALQDTHGVDQLLIWQARASRAAVERPCGITPAYYHACAAQATCDVYRPLARWSAPVPSPPELSPGAAQTSTELDPACDALLRAMGVRERQRLASAPYDLIEAWQRALEHPGMTTQFTNPIGFAVVQIQRGNAPPPMIELDRWAERARRSDDRYESWRYIEGATISGAALTYEQQLEARVRAIAPDGADLTEFCELARLIEGGATDIEALEQLCVRRMGG
jgi:hypothetical protein